MNPFANLTIQDIMTVILTVATAIVSTYLFVKRKFSQTSLEVQKDKAEEGIMTLLQKERDRAIADREKIIERLQVVDREKADLLTLVQENTLKVDGMKATLDFIKSLQEQDNEKISNMLKLTKMIVSEHNSIAARVDLLSKSTS